MRKLSCLLLVGALVLVLSSVVLATMPKEDLDINLRVHPHATIEFDQDQIVLNLYNDHEQSTFGEAYFTIKNNAAIDIDVDAWPFFAPWDQRNISVGYNLNVDRGIPLPLFPWWSWSRQCSTGSAWDVPNGKFEKGWEWGAPGLYRVTAWAWRTADWWTIEAGDDYFAKVIFTVSAKTDS